ncbi:MAG: hypothetical protein IT379_02795 [Deltaproteobacteria bacterium]|nr:hypothetical protein [Deltaproteobacteria bacterium]
MRGFALGLSVSALTTLACLALPNRSRAICCGAACCFIDGACRSTGAPDPASACRSCQPATSQTQWTVAAGMCFIDGACRASGAVNPSNPCQACAPATSTTAWSPTNIGGACADDGLACTDDRCGTSGACEHPINTGCLIAGACIAAATVNPANVCQHCDTAAPTAWSPRTGVACADDGLACTNDVCGGAGTCTHPVTTGCVIGGSCIADGTVNPGNVCQRCNAGVSDSGYSNVPDGTVCSDALACNGTEACMGGVCTRTPLTCDDAVACTTDSCVEPTGCRFTPVSGCCGDVDCDDGDPCTTSVCSGPGGTCSHSVITGCCMADGDCEDGNPCTANACVANRCATTPVAGCCDADGDCDDGNTCTADACTVASGECTYTAIAGCCASDADCDDGDACTADVCAGAACTRSPIAGCCASDLECDDGDPCTSDTCDVVAHRCQTTELAGCRADAGPSDDAGSSDDGGAADAGPPSSDAAPPRDAGRADGGADDGGLRDMGATTRDSGSRIDSGASGGGDDDGGCGCSVPGRRRSPLRTLGLLVVASIVWCWRRRSRRRTRQGRAEPSRRDPLRR